MTVTAKTLRLCVVQHHPLETPGYVLNWAQSRGMQVRIQHAWEFNQSRQLHEFDALIILGGPSSVSDARVLPWLAQEISWLKSCVVSGVPIFGICLGAQLLAHCLDAAVEPMATLGLPASAELGWVEIKLCNELAAHAALDPIHQVLQWHADTFQVPAGAIRLASSANGHCNQGYAIAERRLMGVQFHPEWNASTFASLIDCLADAETTVSLRAALSQTGLFNKQEALCAALLDFWIQRD